MTTHLKEYFNIQTILEDYDVEKNGNSKRGWVPTNSFREGAFYCT